MGSKSSKKDDHTWDMLDTAVADKDFFNTLQTGDVMLAATASSQANLVRGVMGKKMRRTRWDHVFVVLRRDYERSGEPIGDHKIKAGTKCDPGYCSCTKTWVDGANGEDRFVLEMVDATTTGLHIFNLKERLARLSSYFSHVAVRRLRGPERTPEQFERLEKFLLTVRGMGYRIKLNTICGMLCNCTAHHVKNSEHNKQASSNGWFCSEIVTRSLMELGVLQSDTSQDSFLPSDFSTLKQERGGFEELLVDGYSFGPEQLFVSPGSPFHLELMRMKTLMNEQRRLRKGDTRVHNFRNSKVHQKKFLGNAKVAPDVN